MRILTFRSGDLPVALLQQKVLQIAVDDCYNNLAEQGLTPPLGRDVKRFELTNSGRQLRLKIYPSIDFVNSRSRRPLSLSTIGSRRDGGKAIRDELGFSDWMRQTRLPAPAVVALSNADKELGGAAAAIDNVELQYLAQTANETSDVVHTLDTTFAVVDTPPPLSISVSSEAWMRLYKPSEASSPTTLPSSVSLMSTSLSKRGNYYETSKVGIEEFTRHHIAKRLRDLQDEKASRLEAATGNREDIRSQTSRMIYNLDSTVL